MLTFLDDRITGGHKYIFYTFEMRFIGDNELQKFAFNLLMINFLLNQRIGFRGFSVA